MKRTASTVEWSKGARVFCAMCFLLAMVAVTFATEPSAVPERFVARIGGFMGTSYRIELHNGILTYTATGRGQHDSKPTTLKPTAAQWIEFRQALDELKVWRWRAEYPNNGVMDGTQWSLEVTYADRGIKTQGSNNYPEAAGEPNGKPELTKAFERYLEAVRKLTGKSFG